MEQLTITRKRSDIEGDFLECPVFLIEECDENGVWNITEGAWFTRQEAEKMAKKMAHRLGTWRVKSIAARGELKKALASHTHEDVLECPRCGEHFSADEDQIVVCPECCEAGSTKCCCPGGKNCICPACEENA